MGGAPPGAELTEDEVRTRLETLLGDALLEQGALPRGSGEGYRFERVEGAPPVFAGSWPLAPSSPGGSSAPGSRRFTRLEWVLGPGEGGIAVHRKPAHQVRADTWFEAIALREQ